MEPRGEAGLFALGRNPKVICSRLRRLFIIYLMPTAETLHCPSCGAGVPSDATKCSFCGAQLATVACPRCFGMMFVGQKFCPHCGALAQRVEVAGGKALDCPKCKTAMKQVEVGKSALWECAQCEGTWVDAETVKLICSESDQQAAVLNLPVVPSARHPPDLNFRYVPCPVCSQLMNRVNFARSSGVIIDVCRDHGTWFDKDELRRVVEFIRSGGMDKARARQMAEDEAEHERRMNAATAGIPASMQNAETWNDRWSGPDIVDIAGWLIGLFK